MHMLPRRFRIIVRHYRHSPADIGGLTRFEFPTVSIVTQLGGFV